MKLSDLTETEWKVWESATPGTLVDLRVGDAKLDSPEQWAEWGRSELYGPRSSPTFTLAKATQPL